MYLLFALTVASLAGMLTIFCSVKLSLMIKLIAACVYTYTELNELILKMMMNTVKFTFNENGFLF